MTHSMAQTQACSEMAQLLASFLPGSGSPQWRGHVTFAAVAHDVGVAEFWSGGSKVPAVARLLDQTLTQRRRLFEPLILAIVREGMHYRGRRGDPVTRDEIVRLNSLLHRVSFQFPSLLDPAFLDHLPKRSASQPDAGQTSQARQVPVMTPAPAPQVRLLALRDEFYRLAGMDDRQAAGLALEGLLNAVFDLFQMAPRAPFRLVGEQIDGSFALDHQTYLLEAKWERQPTSLADLLIFQGKIQAKSTFTRGVFVAISGVTQEARDGFSRGRQPSFIVLDGYDLTAVLEGHVALDALLRAKQRRVAEEGRIAVSVTELFD